MRPPFEVWGPQEASRLRAEADRLRAEADALYAAVHRYLAATGGGAAASGQMPLQNLSLRERGPMAAAAMQRGGDLPPDGEAGPGGRAGINERRARPRTRKVIEAIRKAGPGGLSRDAMRKVAEEADDPFEGSQLRALIYHLKNAEVIAEAGDDHWRLVGAGASGEAPSKAGGPPDAPAETTTEPAMAP